MNCQDITRILDDGDINLLAEARRVEAETHLAGCSACRMELQVQRRLSVSAVPPLPQGLVARCRKRVAAGSSHAGAQRRIRRVILATTILVVAAAAVVTLQVARSPATLVASAPVAVGQPDESRAAATQSELAIPVNPAATEIMEPTKQPAPIQEKPATAATAMLVRLMQPDIKGLDADSAAILDQFHQGFARRLALIPGVTILSPDMPPPAGGRYLQITMKIAGVQAGGAHSIYVDTRPIRDGTIEEVFIVTVLVEPGSDMAIPLAKAIEPLRRLAIPADPALGDQLHAQLHDPTADQATRLAVLNKMLSAKQDDPAKRREVFGMALDMMAASETDPSARDNIWNRLQNMISAELMEAANDALGRQQDAEIRRKLLTVISTSLRLFDDPRLRADMQTRAPELTSAMEAIAPAVRARLESVASTDPNQLNRMIARRGRVGEGEWNKYVVTSLKDTTLTDAERLAAFASFGGAGPQTVVNNPLLDEAAIRSAGELVARAGRNPDQETQAINAVNALAGVRGDAARDAALEILRPGNGLNASSPVRAAMLVPLMVQKGADPAVRQVVEQLASGDADQLMRRRATEALQVMDQLVRDHLPLQLLQNSALIESATLKR